MKHLTLLLIGLYSLCTSAQPTDNQPTETNPKALPRFFVGVAFGASFALGDFGDTDVNNADAGYAQNGNRYDLYGGYLLNKRVTLTAGLRYQTFETDVSDVVDLFNTLNPNTTFEGENGNWESFYLLVGAAYKLPLTKRFALYPRLGVGPFWIASPDLEVQATDGMSQNNFSRSSETGLGLGYEIGVGLRTDLGKRLALLPTFTFSGGSARIAEVETQLNSLSSTRDFTASLLSFNLGLSLAFRL